MTFQPADPADVARIRERLAEMRAEQTAPVCPYCNATAKAIREVQARWVVAGMDKGE